MIFTHNKTIYKCSFFLRKCPHCENEHRDILEHIIVECETTQIKTIKFLETVRMKFGEQLYNEMCIMPVPSIK